MFCVECGREIDIFRDGTCINCYIKNNSFTKGSEIIDIISCPHCNSFKFKNTWTNDNFDDILKRIIKKTFFISNELKDVDIIINECDKKEKKLCKITISGFLDTVKINEDHDVLIRIKKTVCDVCSRRYGGYHEAVLQIRANKRKLSKKEIQNIHYAVENLILGLHDKGNRALFLTDVGIEHGGIDFYLSDKGSAYTIIKKIQDKYGGIIKKSSKNIGMKDSKQIYRMTYLLRLPSFRKGDFIFYNETYFYISAIYGDYAHVFDLSGWMENTIDVNELEKGNVIGGKELIKDMIFINQSDDDLQIMDPDSYKTIIIRKPKIDNFDFNKVKFVKFGNDIFLVPINILITENNKSDK
jgi:nonsense-mediated mRNA decay protein 3